jgi:prepilin signal peptidase PulO-like enzyme (type II secretory pathway)
LLEQLAIYPQMGPWERAILLFPLGLAIGSFSTVILHRRRMGLSLLEPRSRCLSCGHTLGARELIPLVSFMWQRGRCRDCGAHIPWRYPLMELTSGILAALSGAALGWMAGFAAMLLWVVGVSLLASRAKRQAL